MSIKMTAAVLAAMVGGVAQAAPMFVVVEDLGGVQITARANGLSREPLDGGEVLRNPGSFGASVAYGAGELGSGIDELFADASMTTSFSDTSFSITSSVSGALTRNAGFDPNNPADEANIVAQGVHEGAVTLTEDAMVRIRVDGDRTAIDPGAFRVELSGPSLAPLSIGLDSQSATAPPFDITVELAAGTYEWFYNHDYGGNAVAGSYAWDGELSLSFEIVPAPGAAALFGLGGLAATRRRR